MRLVLDAGHGGRDPGAVANGLVERELNADMRLAAAQILQGFPEIWLRLSGADGSSLTQRGAFSHDHRAHLVISIHHNAATPKASGLMAFYWPGNAMGKAVAEQIQRSAPAPLAKRSSKPPYKADGRFPRVRNVLGRHACTAVLVECGFLTNRSDAEALRTFSVQQGIAASIVAGVMRGFAFL